MVDKASCMPMDGGAGRSVGSEKGNPELVFFPVRIRLYPLHNGSGPV